MTSMAATLMACLLLVGVGVCGADTDITCESDTFSCGHGGRCIPKAWQCDGENDCDDGSDESDCDRSCGPNEFKCRNSTRCIPLAWRCDGDRDCVDGSDETDCSVQGTQEPDDFSNRTFVAAAAPATSRDWLPLVLIAAWTAAAH